MRDGPGAGSRGNGAQADVLRRLEQQFHRQFEMEGGGRDSGADAGAAERTMRRHGAQDGVYDDSSGGADDSTDTSSSGASAGDESDHAYRGDENDVDATFDDLDDAVDLLHASKRPERTRSGKERSAPSPSAPAARACVPETVVFVDPAQKDSADAGSKRARKQFMSSKTEHLHRDAPADAEPEPGGSDREDDDQRANDRKLTELLSTTLFAPGAATASAAGKKRKMNSTTNETLARIFELSAADSLGKKGAPGHGWGEQQRRAQELGKMPSAMRAGIRRAAGERRDREIETQKELGLWNPAVHNKSRMVQGTSTERGTRNAPQKNRVRGIGSGVGSFRGGTLHVRVQDR
ncbi:hypothetical protein MSPP1_003634 [Malassezia sp. CBS 17886]|nr:hypothetical protein MSPP1_003634 [Malassezia sp. CBS 17886]